eukprot:459801_1
MLSFVVFFGFILLVKSDEYLGNCSWSIGNQIFDLSPLNNSVLSGTLKTLQPLNGRGDLRLSICGNFINFIDSTGINKKVLMDFGYTDGQKYPFYMAEFDTKKYPPQFFNNVTLVWSYDNGQRVNIPNMGYYRVQANVYLECNPLIQNWQFIHAYQESACCVMFYMTWSSKYACPI